MKAATPPEKAAIAIWARRAQMSANVAMGPRWPVGHLSLAAKCLRRDGRDLPDDVDHEDVPRHDPGGEGHLNLAVVEARHGAIRGLDDVRDDAVEGVAHRGELVHDRRGRPFPAGLEGHGRRPRE